MHDQQARLNTWVRGLAALFMLWNSLAFAYVQFTTESVNDDKVPDRMQQVTAAQLASEVGIVDGRTSLVTTLPTASSTPLAKVMGSGSHPVIGPVLQLEVVSAGQPVKKVELPYSRVTWVTGSEASMKLQYKTGVIKAPYVGQGYDYWRFLTFRGPERYVYAANAATPSSFCASPAEFLTDCTNAVEITTPDNPVWRGYRAFGS